MQRNHQFEFERIRIQKSNSNSNANSNQNTASHNDFGIPLKLITEAHIEQHYSQTQSIAETRRRGIRLDLGSRHGKRWRGHSWQRLTSIGLLIHGRTGTFFFCFASFIPTATQARLLASGYCILSCGGCGSISTTGSFIQESNEVVLPQLPETPNSPGQGAKAINLNELVNY